MSFEIPIRAALREVDPLPATFHVQSMDDYVASSLAARSFTLSLIAMFGISSVLLAAMGIYGVISYVVGLRTREFGIRMSLGAKRHTIVKLVLGDVLVLLAWGLAAGLMFAWALSRFLAHLLFEVRPNDLATLAGVAWFLTCVALLAGYFPARRAATVDPTQALRSE